MVDLVPTAVVTVLETQFGSRAFMKFCMTANTEQLTRR